MIWLTTQLLLFLQTTLQLLLAIMLHLTLQFLSDSKHRHLKRQHISEPFHPETFLSFSASTSAALTNFKCLGLRKRCRTSAVSLATGGFLHEGLLYCCTVSSCSGAWVQKASFLIWPPYVCTLQGAFMFTHRLHPQLPGPPSDQMALNYVMSSCCFQRAGHSLIFNPVRHESKVLWRSLKAADQAV